MARSSTTTSDQTTTTSPAARRRSHRVLFACAAAFSVALAGLIGTTQSVAASPGPVLDVNFPDPDVIEVGGTYHAYATNSGGSRVQHATSSDLRSWTMRSDVLPRLGDWADTGCSFSPGGNTDDCVWAPDVSAVDGGYALYYTARDRASGRQCIGVATSGSPDGIFVPRGAGPLVCPADAGGAIDASTFVENGQHYLLWKNDGNCCVQDTWLHLQPTSSDGLTLTGPPTRLIRQDLGFEGSLVEAPELVRQGGSYVLFYSANFFGNASYLTSYATSSNLTGPYTKAPAPLMTTDSFSGTVRGPGGQDVVRGTDGRDYIVFHGWDAGYTRRSMYLAELGWAGELPVVRGSKVHYEAENGAVSNAVVRGANGAAGGRAVGYIDYADSSVTMTVFATRSGDHTLTVRFGNGSTDGGPVGASHTLTVNGQGQGEVYYPHTGWDNWSNVERTVSLSEGWNTIRLGHRDHWAELDAIQIA